MKKALKITLISLSAIAILYIIVGVFFAVKARGIVNSIYESNGVFFDKILSIVEEEMAEQINYRKFHCISDDGEDLKEVCLKSTAMDHILHFSTLGALIFTTNIHMK